LLVVVVAVVICEIIESELLFLQLDAVQKMVAAVEKSLKLVSDQLAVQYVSSVALLMRLVIFFDFCKFYDNIPLVLLIKEV